jgi:RNA polymerase sigma-70 factor (sigma-E family)
VRRWSVRRRQVEKVDDAPTRSDGFEQLYGDEYEPMLRLAFLLLRSTEAAEEAVHDAFAKVYERWNKVDNHGGYLRTCVVNRCKDFARRQRVARRHIPVIAPTADLGARELVDALGRLSMKRRAAVVLRYYEGLSEAEIASVLGVPAGTVKSLLSRALAQLREEVPRP